MKDGYRFVDCDMHIMEPTDLFDKYLEPAFRQRVTSSPRPTNSGSTGMRRRPLWFFDAAPISNDGNISQYNRIRDRSSPRAPTQTSCSPSSVDTTPRRKSWAWRWRGSI